MLDAEFHGMRENSMKIINNLLTIRPNYKSCSVGVLKGSYTTFINRINIFYKIFSSTLFIIQFIKDCIIA